MISIIKLEMRLRFPETLELKQYLKGDKEVQLRILL